MTRETLALEIGGGTIWLHALRAAYLPAERALLVADAHFGKAQAFRRSGVPVPAGTTAANLARLDRLIEHTAASKLIFLGDLLHARSSLNEALDQAFSHWRARHARLQVLLVRGNHDSSAGDPPAAWAIEAVDGPWALGPWALCHEPAGPPQGRIPECEARRFNNAPAGPPQGRIPECEARRFNHAPAGPPQGRIPECEARRFNHAPADRRDAYVLAGHVHPTTGIGRGLDRMRLPCFHFGATAGVLPAFGAFTGGHPVRPVAGDVVVAVADGELHRVAG